MDDIIILLGENDNNIQIFNIVSKIKIENEIMIINNKDYIIDNIDEYSNYRIIADNMKINELNWYLFRGNKKFFNILNKGNSVILCCDCDWHLQTDSWINLYNEKYIKNLYHIGDQIYNDLLINRLINNLSNMDNYVQYKKQIKNKIYQNYFKSWNNLYKKHLLTSYPNLMIGDDHDIYDDDTEHINDHYLFIKECALEVYQEIQINLRIDNKKSDFYYKIDNNILHIFFGRTLNFHYSVQDFINYIDEILFKATITKIKDIYLIFSKPPINKNPRGLSKLFFKPVNDDFNIFYDYLLKLKNLNLNISIIAGDLHRQVISSVFYNKKFLTNLIIIPSMTSCSPLLNSKIFLNLPNSFKYKIFEEKRTNGYLLLNKNKFKIKSKNYYSNYLRNEIVIFYKITKSKFQYENLVYF